MPATGRVRCDQQPHQEVDRAVPRNFDCSRFVELVMQVETTRQMLLSSRGFQTFRPMYFSPHGRFAQTLDDSPHGRFALWSIRPMVDSPPRRFAPWTIRPMVDSPTPRWLCIRDDSPHGRFAPLTFCNGHSFVTSSRSRLNTSNKKSNNGQQSGKEKQMSFALTLFVLIQVLHVCNGT